MGGQSMATNLPKSQLNLITRKYKGAIHHVSEASELALGRAWRVIISDGNGTLSNVYVFRDKDGAYTRSANFLDFVTDIENVFAERKTHYERRIVSIQAKLDEAKDILANKKLNLRLYIAYAAILITLSFVATFIYLKVWRPDQALDTLWPYLFATVLMSAAGLLFGRYFYPTLPKFLRLGSSGD